VIGRGIGNIEYTDANRVLPPPLTRQQQQQGAVPPRRHDAVPNVAALPGTVLIQAQLIAKEDLEAVMAKEPQQRPARAPAVPLAYHAKKLSTRAAHLRDLTKFQQWLVKGEDRLRGVPLASACWMFIQSQRREAAQRSARPCIWLPQTTLRYATNLHGALADLELYAHNVASLHLCRSAEWTSALAALQSIVNETSLPTFESATADEVKRAVLLCKDEAPAAAATLLVQFAGGLRARDAQDLRRKFIALNRATGDLTLQMRETKTSARRGPYTIETRVADAELREFLSTYLASLSPDAQLMPSSAENERARAQRTAAMNVVLKKVRKSLATRAVRRGALQALATGAQTGKPTDVRTLMSYSGHTSEKKLKRYLDWGRLFGEQTLAQRAAAANLQPAC
jgi:hypothetical protein